MPERCTDPTCTEHWGPTDAESAWRIELMRMERAALKELDPLLDAAVAKLLAEADE